ncbi:Maf family protein [Halanaerobaculum tunisiense]
MEKIILASSSPRRRSLLEQLDFDFVVYPSGIDESQVQERNPHCLVQKLSRLKATKVAREREGIVIGADTVVELEDELLEKPVNRDDAYKMLTQLSGRSHQVVTGITVVWGEQSLTDYQKTEVFFRELSASEIEDYISTGEPLDKAGSYGLQGKGAILVKKINGSFYNVVGLPVTKLVQMLKQIGVEVKFSE